MLMFVDFSRVLDLAQCVSCFARYVSCLIMLIFILDWFLDLPFFLAGIFSEFLLIALNFRKRSEEKVKHCRP